MTGRGGGGVTEPRLRMPDGRLEEQLKLGPQGPLVLVVTGIITRPYITTVLSF